MYYRAGHATISMSCVKGHIDSSLVLSAMELCMLFGVCVRSKSEPHIYAIISISCRSALISSWSAA